MATQKDNKMETHLSNGYRAAPVSEETTHSAIDCINACWRNDNGGDFTNYDEFATEWKTEGFNRDTDAITVLDAQGQVVGYADLFDIAAPHVRLDTLAAVHPDHRGRGIGSFLLKWLIQRAQNNLHKAPDGAKVILKQGVNSNNQAARELFLRHGFEATRSAYRMRIDFDRPPAAPHIPEGIIIRSIQPGEERTALWTAWDSFHDHWGFVEQPFEEYYQQHMFWAQNNPDHDPSLWFIALDGKEVAGVAICLPKIFEDPELAYVNTLGVRRAWRKRGIGLALLQHAFCEFYQRGKTRAGLGVDATSLTRATHLYTKAGMRVTQEFTTYELEIRPGIDLATKSIEQPEEMQNPAQGG